MKAMMRLAIALSVVLMLTGVSYAGIGQILLADQDIPVGVCEVIGFTDNFESSPQVCVRCGLNPFGSLIDGLWCGDEVKWDTGVEIATGMVITVTQTKKYNPIPGRFPYGGQFINGPVLENLNECHTTFFDCAPAAEACVSGEQEPGVIRPVVAAVHAGVYNDLTEETAWLAECLQNDGLSSCQLGTQFAGKNWATYVHVPCFPDFPGVSPDGLGQLFCVGAEPRCGLLP